MRTIVEHALAPVLITAARAALTGWTRYELIDRGRYDFIDTPAVPGVLAVMRDLAAAQLGFAVTVVDVRAVRLGAGDYLLSHHDRSHADPLVELIADLSEAVAPAAVHYREAGKPWFVVPSAPGSIAVVARTASTAANHTYVSQQYSGPAVTRIVARLR